MDEGCAISNTVNKGFFIGKATRTESIWSKILMVHKRQRRDKVVLRRWRR